jgi:hypothetical protein
VTLTEFLLARIAGDEATAHLTSEVFMWATDTTPGMDIDALHPVLVEHIRTWTSARVLAECEAKRRIVELHPPRWAYAYRDSERLLAEAFDQETVKVEASSGPIYDPELRLLALPYADHPDCLPEWQP